MKITCFESAGLTADYFTSNSGDRAVLRDFADDPAEGDCATAIPAVTGAFNLAVERRPHSLEIDLSPLRSLDDGCAVEIARGCNALLALGVQISFVEPLNCRMDRNAAERLQKIYQACEPAISSPAAQKMQASRHMVQLGAKIIVALLFYFIFLSVWLALLNHPVPRDSRYAMDVVMALGASVMTKFLGEGDASTHITIPLGKERTLKVDLTGPPAVFVSVFLITRLYG